MFLARREGRPEPYALKVHTGPRDRETLIRLQLEAEVTARLDHPGIVKVRDHGVIDGRDYILLDYCEGESLEQRLRRGPLPWGEAVAIVGEVARTMGAAHAQGVLHRDLKPANVLLEARSGQPKLIDFGLAQDRSLVQSLTQSRAVMGTPVTMAPEQLRSTKHADARADVYSLGVMLYWCLTGRPPFEASSLLELERRIAQDPPLPPSQAAPDLPAGLERLCLRALAKSPVERPADAGAFADLLERAARRPAGQNLRRAERRLPAALALGIALLGASVAGWWVWRASTSAPSAPTPTIAEQADALLAELRRREHAFAPLAELREVLDRAERATASDPALLARVRLARADACRRRGDYQAAIEAAPVEAAGSIGLGARWLQGLCYLRTGRRDEAVQIWRALAADDPGGVSGLDAQAILAIIDGDDRWPEIGQRCEAADPTNYHARVVGAYGRWRLQSAAVALADLEAIGRDEPDDTHVHFVRAFILSGERDWAGAREAYTEVLRRTAPFASTQALEGRAWCNALDRRWADALADYERLLAIDPRNVHALLIGGVCRYELGDPDAAADDWRAACRSREPETWEQELLRVPPELAEQLRRQAERIPPEPR